MVNFLTKLFGSRNDRLLKQYRKAVARINAMESELEKLGDQTLRAKTQEFKDRLAQGASWMICWKKHLPWCVKRLNAS